MAGRGRNSGKKNLFWYVENMSIILPKLVERGFMPEKVFEGIWLPETERERLYIEGVANMTFSADLQENTESVSGIYVFSKSPIEGNEEWKEFNYSHVPQKLAGKAMAAKRYLDNLIEKNKAEKGIYGRGKIYDQYAKDIEKIFGQRHF